MKKLALVAMPWNCLNVPNPSIGLLASVVRSHRADYDVKCYYSYVDLAISIGTDWYTLITDRSPLCELLYAVQMYPERRSDLQALFIESFKQLPHDSQFRSPAEAFDTILQATRDHLKACVEELANNFDVIGLTNSCAQLFPAIALSEELRKYDKSVKIVMGGWVSDVVGPALLELYPSIDYLVCGDGEEAIVQVLDEIQERGCNPSSQTDPAIRRCITGRTASDLNALPIPDYDGYPEKAEQCDSLIWDIAIEGSRGCWWDRVARTGNPRHACFFCSTHNTVFNAKKPGRVVREMEVLAGRYNNVRFKFLDESFPVKSGLELISAILRSKYAYSFFCEVRADISSYELMMLKEAGCSHVQLGIEGLSSFYLRRINKGIKTIQNLQAMKTCYELQIENSANILTGFPGASSEEVQDTVKNILNYGILYQPLQVSKFVLQGNSCVTKLPEMFLVCNMRNHDNYRVVLPDHVLSKVRLPVGLFDTIDTLVDWRPVEAAIEHWRLLHQKIAASMMAGHEHSFFITAPLYYLDYGIALYIVDRRSEVEAQVPNDCVVGNRHIELNEQWRKVYLHCMQIREIDAVIKLFSSEMGQDKVREMLDDLHQARLLFIEDGQCLSLAVATAPHIAAERIRKAHDKEA
jgi:ribosomal peptide maturation radical SAM protein 1